MNDLDAVRDELREAIQERERWNAKRLANQVKTTADWHLHNNAHFRAEQAIERWVAACRDRVAA